MRISDWSSDVCSSDLLGDPFLPRRREEDQREAARLIVEAANLLESDQLEETGGGVGVGDPDHGVKIFGHAPNIVPRRRNGTGALPLQRRLSIANSFAFGASLVTLNLFQGPWPDLDYQCSGEREILPWKIGRTSCREKGCKSEKISV